jgi:hypothetical protein
MPTMLRTGPFRFYFYRDDLSAKFGWSPWSWHGIRDCHRRNCAEFKGSSFNIKKHSWRHGIGILATSADERVADVRFSRDALSVDLFDGRTITVPLAWYPRLLNASVKQRQNWRVAGGGYGIHWPDIDEDLSTEGLLRGAPAPRQKKAKISKS